MDFSWQNSDCALVRELGWSLFSPSILEINLPDGIAPWEIPWDDEARCILKAVQDNPRHLNAWLGQRNDRRLGARFEGLWHYFLEQHSFYDVLTYNRQIFDGKQTIGALDFLIRDHFRHGVVHLELAVKFYLYVPGVPGASLAQWIGPNPDDNLELKYRHLLDHQLPLSGDSRTCRDLRQQGLTLPDRQWGAMKGVLFRPLEHAQMAVTAPAPVITDCSYGWWLRSSDSRLLTERWPRHQWRLMAKTTWLDPEERGDKLIDPQHLDTTLLQQGPIMVTGTAATGHGERQRASKTEKVFIVPEQWPEKEVR